MKRRLSILFAVTAYAVSHLAAQTPTPQAALEPNPYQVAVEQFQAHQFAAALASFKQLMAEQPANGIYKKFASEAALDSGDPAFAMATMLPVEQANPSDYEARMLLARAYAQTADQPGHREKRNDEIVALVRLHKETPDSPLGKLRDFLLEDVVQGKDTVRLYPAFTPWGPYNVHLIARFFIGTPPQPGLRVTLESGDGDQLLFAKEHPAEAATGKRSFSLDGYAPDRKGPDGRTIQTHYTYAFFVGEPTYDDVRARVLEIASGKLKPLSSRSGPVD